MENRSHDFRSVKAAPKPACQRAGSHRAYLGDVRGHLRRTTDAIGKSGKTRSSLPAFHALITIGHAATWSFDPCGKQVHALGDGVRLLWRGRRIVMFAQAVDVVCVAWLAGLTAMSVVFTGYFFVRHGALEAAVDGPLPLITDSARVSGLFTLLALVAVMAVAITRAVTALSVRQAIRETREQEERRSAEEASSEVLTATQTIEAVAGPQG